MRNACLSRFMADERGGGTIMGLFWFMVLVAAAGLAVDTTDGLRNKTMLQATADSAALAAAIDLPDETLEMPAKSLIQEVVIVSECLVTFHAKVTMVDVVLASRNGGNGDVTTPNIEVNAQVQFGARDECATGGGVQMFSNASMYFNAKTTFDGVQMVAAGNIGLNAQEEGSTASPPRRASTSR